MLLKNALVLALLLAAAVEADAGHAVRGEKHNGENTRERRIKKTKKKTKPTSASSSGGAGGAGGAATRAGGAAGGTTNRASGAGGGKKKNSGKKKSGSGGQSVVNRFGTPGGPSYTPQVWSPGNLRGSTTPNFDVGQNGQPAGGAVPVPIGTIGNKAGEGGPTYNVYVQPNSPGTTTATTGWSGVNRAGGNVAMTGRQCQSSNPNKFRCCNNEGSGACASAGFGNCCDAFRNMCVNTAGLDPTARSNLVCKP